MKPSYHLALAFFRGAGLGLWTKWPAMSVKVLASPSSVSARSE
ncbi:MAG: hypothetical protein Q8N23_29920 [Archangium sp.]|nr:hypothetical protein [Archangium sp.]MDP3156926.1 hypothetical protein [Archangium sp.]MDP3575606.1 hypothetical protein [Archangium sp.]